MPPELILFDDAVARDWMPFALTRPAGELRFGALTLRERAERVFQARCSGHITHEALAGFDEPGAAPVLGPAVAGRDRDRIFFSSRAVPAWGEPPRPGPGAELLAVDGEVCGWFAPAGSEGPPPEFFLDPAGRGSWRLRVRSLEGRLLRRVWEIVLDSADQVARDVAALHPEPAGPRLPPGAHRIGDAPLVLGPDVRVEPGVVFDLTEGPIWLDEGVAVQAFTRLAGPAYVGPRGTLLGGSFRRISAGPVCKLHGELEEAVVLGYANKAHAGYIGHACLGAWVNLGALTTNSDLKNNYGPVRVWTPRGEEDSGAIKLGSLIGDHVKTGIGTLLNTGTVIGAGTCLYGTAMPPRYVPPFSWGTGDALTEYDLDKFLETTEIVMARREVPLRNGQRTLLRAAWHRGRGQA